MMNDDCFNDDERKSKSGLESEIIKNIKDTRGIIISMTRFPIIIYKNKVHVLCIS